MLKACPVVGKRKSLELCEAFIAGAPRDAKGFVFYGAIRENLKDWYAARRSGLPVWNIDNSYFDCVRGSGNWAEDGAQYRITKNRMQVEVDNKTSDGKRFAALGLTIKSWQHNLNGHVVLVQQSDEFMRDIAGDPDWFNESLAYLKSQNDRVVVRAWSPNKLKLQRTLVDDLAGARMLVTHSSAAAVTAVLEGIPVIVTSQSALAYMICSDGPAIDQRLRYLSVLADNQFTLQEMKDGTAWAMLNR